MTLKDTIRGKKYLVVFTRRKEGTGPPNPPKEVRHDGMRLQKLGKWFDSPPKGTDPLWGLILLIDYQAYPPEVEVCIPPVRIVHEGWGDEHALQN